MAMSIMCKLAQKLEEIKGEGQRGSWVKQSFVTETIESYPRKICFIAWNDRVETLRNINIGSAIEVEFRLDSREFNGRWYTDAIADRVSLLNAATASSAAATTMSTSTYGTPATSIANPITPAEDEILNGGSGDDDLPF
jgi:hypothetical protein